MCEAAAVFILGEGVIRSWLGLLVTKTARQGVFVTVLGGGGGQLPPVDSQGRA